MIDPESFAKRAQELEEFRIKLSSRVRELEEELRQERMRLHQHEGAVSALQDILKGINEKP